MSPYTAWRSAVAAVALYAAAAGTAAAQVSPVLDPATSKKIADKIVNQSARVRPGELVWLQGGERDLPLLEDLAVAVRKVGAHPIIEYGSNRLMRRFVTEVPASLDTVTPQLRTLKITDVLISTDYVDPRSAAGFDPLRLNTLQKARAPFREALLNWKGRAVSLGNGLYPTPGAANQAGIPVDRMAALYRAGLDVDYAALERTAEALREALAHGKEIRLSAPNGTDLRARIAGQTVYTSDGVLSDADQSAGVAQATAYLPAGEVYVVASPGSAEGTLVGDRSWYVSDRIDGLRAVVTGGKVTGLAATRGAAALLTNYEAAGAGKSQVGVIDIGLNPAVEAPAGSHLQPWSQAGIVTVTIGNNQWAGGDNVGGFSFPFHIEKATLTVDGTPLVRNGRLVLPAANPAR